MSCSFTHFPSDSLNRSLACLTVLATLPAQFYASDDVSPLREQEQQTPRNAELSEMGGSLAYSEDELAQLFVKLEEERREQEPNEGDYDVELEVYTLNAIQVSPLDLELYERLEVALRTGSSESLLKESKIEKRMRLEKLYAERADQRFWSGEYDGTYNPDVPKVGSIDLSRLFDGMTNLLGKNKAKKLDLSER